MNKLVARAFDFRVLTLAVAAALAFTVTYAHARPAGTQNHATQTHKAWQARAPRYSAAAGPTAQSMKSAPAATVASPPSTATRTGPAVPMRASPARRVASPPWTAPAARTS